MDIKDRFIIDTILEKFNDMKDPTLMILQNIQEILGCVREEYLTYVAESNGFSLTELYGIVSFYPQFRLSPPGKHIIKICKGTACHVRGGAAIQKSLQNLLGIKPGETTEDGIFSLESVRCLGCCGLSPVIMVDDETYGRVKTSKLQEILAKYKEVSANENQ